LDCFGCLVLGNFITGGGSGLPYIELLPLEPLPLENKPLEVILLELPALEEMIDLIEDGDALDSPTSWS